VVWSIFYPLTGASVELLVAHLVRFLFGAGELEHSQSRGALALVSHSLERAFAQGSCKCEPALAAWCHCSLVVPLLAAFRMAHSLLDLRYGHCLGLDLWRKWYRDSPGRRLTVRHRHSHCNKLFRSRSWLIVLMYSTVLRLGLLLLPLWLHAYLVKDEESCRAGEMNSSPALPFLLGLREPRRGGRSTRPKVQRARNESRRFVML